MALEEPSVSEMIRAIDARTLRMEQQMSAYVTRELYDRDMAEVKKDLSDLQARRQHWWTGLALPAMVVVFGMLLQEWIK